MICDPIPCIPFPLIRGRGRVFFEGAWISSGEAIDIIEDGL